MKNYNKPEIEITNLNNVDVVLVSGITTNAFTVIDNTTVKYNEVSF